MGIFRSVFAIFSHDSISYIKYNISGQLAPPGGPPIAQNPKSSDTRLVPRPHGSEDGGPVI